MSTLLATEGWEARGASALSTWQPCILAVALPSWMIDASLALAGLALCAGLLCGALSLRTWQVVWRSVWIGAKLAVVGIAVGVGAGAWLWPDSGQSGLLGMLVTGPLAFALSVLLVLTRAPGESAPPTRRP